MNKAVNILKSFSLVFSLGILCIHFDLWCGMRRGICPTLLGVVAGGVGTQTSINAQYLPQLIWFTTASNPDVNIKIAGADGTIWDITGLGVNEFATIRQMSRTANYYLLQLANSLVKDRTVTFAITNQNAAAFNLYGSSMNTLNKADIAYTVAVSQTILANSGAEFRKFRYLAMPSAGATDRYVINYKDGTSQNYDSRDELKADLQLVQNSISAAGYNIDNASGMIDSVQVFPAAQQTVFINKWAAPGNVQSTILARQ